MIAEKILQYLKERNEYIESRKMLIFGADRLMEENEKTMKEIRAIVSDEELQQDVEERR